MTAPTTRRGLFGGSAALLAIGAAGAGKQAPADAELLATCAALLLADDRRRQTDAHTLHLPPDKLDMLDDSWWAIMARLEDMEPVTPEGRTAKANAAYRAAMYEATAFQFGALDRAGVLRRAVHHQGAGPSGRRRCQLGLSGSVAGDWHRSGRQLCRTAPGVAGVCVMRFRWPSTSYGPVKKPPKPPPKW